jgi:hypothetical protein
MRIAVVSAPPEHARNKAGQGYVEALVKGMVSMGHHVDVVDARSGDGYRLPAYEYVVAVSAPISFFSGKIPESLPKILGAGSGLAGKKSAAFIKKSGLFTARALANLMKAMEKEGMMVNWSEVLLNAPHAEAMGKRI